MWGEVDTASTFSISEIWNPGLLNVLFDVCYQSSEEFISWVRGIAAVIKEDEHGEVVTGLGEVED